MQLEMIAWLSHENNINDFSQLQLIVDMFLLLLNKSSDF